MKKIRPLVSVIIAVVVAMSPVCTSSVFAAELDEIPAVESVVEDTNNESNEAVEEIAEECIEVADEATEESNEVVDENNDVAGEATVENDEAASENVAENNNSNIEESVNPEDLTILLRGLTENNKENTFNAINQYISTVLETGNTVTLTNPEYVDAEKYSTETKGYDSNHCWAATASNILWTTGYAQQAINPMTGENFKSEDEVLTYFSENFTDFAGRPSDAVDWFFNGNKAYTLNDVPKVAHIKEDSEYPNETGLLTGKPYSAYTQNVYNDARSISRLYDIPSNGTGLLVRWLEQNENGGYRLSENAHWATVTGVVLDNKKEDVLDKVKALVIADSDNTPANGDLSATTSEKLTAKSNQANTYKVYKVVFDSNLGTWLINNFYNRSAVITHLYGLKDSDKTTQGAACGDTSGTEGASTSSNNVEVPANVQKCIDSLEAGKPGEEIYIFVEQPAVNTKLTAEEAQRMVLNSLTEKDFDKMENIDALLYYMVSNQKMVYLMNDGNVDSNKDYACFVGGVDTMLYNLTVDGTMVPFNAYKIVGTKGGVSKLVLNQDYLTDLAKGAHTVQISVQGSDIPVAFAINVR